MEKTITISEMDYFVSDEETENKSRSIDNYVGSVQDCKRIIANAILN